MSNQPVKIRPTGTADLPFVLQTERDSQNAPYIGQWSQAQHAGAIASQDAAHLIIEKSFTDKSPIEKNTGPTSPQKNCPIGYIILTDLTNPHLTVNLRRIVITEKGKGYGRQALRWAKAFAFDTLKVHRLWFDVIANNHRAQALYKSEGFTIEGTLRDSWKTANGYEDMLILSMLENEYRALKT